MSDDVRITLTCLTAALLVVGLFVPIWAIPDTEFLSGKIIFGPAHKAIMALPKNIADRGIYSAFAHYHITNLALAAVYCAAIIFLFLWNFRD